MPSADLADSGSVGPAGSSVPRPLGLTILAVVLAWFAFQALASALTLTGPGRWLEWVVPRIIGLAAGLAGAVACVGLWKVRPWAYQAYLAWIGTLIGGSLLGTIALAGRSGRGSESMTEVAVWAVVLLPLALYIKRRTDPIQATQYVPRTPFQAGRLEVIIGIVLIVPSVFVLHWMMTDPSAGFLMIVGALLGIGALVACIIGVTLVIGGIWTAYQLPGRVWAHAVPLVGGLATAFYLLGLLD